MDKKTRQLAEWYDKLSQGYDELYGGEQEAKSQRVLHLVAGKKFEILLDVGCGTGTLLRRMADSFSLGVGFDISLEMISKAKAKLPGNVEVVRANCTALPVRKEVADCVLAVSVIDSNGNFARPVWELEQAVRRGGVLLFSVFHPEGKPVVLKAKNGTVLRSSLSPRETLYQLARS